MKRVGIVPFMVATDRTRSAIMQRPIATSASMPGTIDHLNHSKQAYFNGLSIKDHSSCDLIIRKSRTVQASDFFLSLVVTSNLVP